MDFSEEVICEVHPFARIQISDNFTGETFHTSFVNEKACQVDFLSRRSVNGSVQWINVPRPFCENGVATAAWTENLYINPWCHVDSPTRSPDNHINLSAVVRRVRDDILRDNHVERFETLLQETLSQFLLDTRDEVLSDDDWLESDWSY